MWDWWDQCCWFWWCDHLWQCVKICLNFWLRSSMFRMNFCKLCQRQWNQEQYDEFQWSQGSFRDLLDLCWLLISFWKGYNKFCVKWTFCIENYFFLWNHFCFQLHYLHDIFEVGVFYVVHWSLHSQTVFGGNQPILDPGTKKIIWENCTMFLSTTTNVAKYSCSLPKRLARLYVLIFLIFHLNSVDALFQALYFCI